MGQLYDMWQSDPEFRKDMSTSWSSLGYEEKYSILDRTRITTNRGLPNVALYQIVNILKKKKLYDKIEQFLNEVNDTSWHALSEELNVKDLDEFMGRESGDYLEFPGLRRIELIFNDVWLSASEDQRKYMLRKSGLPQRSAQSGTPYWDLPTFDDLMNVMRHEESPEIYEKTFLLLKIMNEVAKELRPEIEEISKSLLEPPKSLLEESDRLSKLEFDVIPYENKKGFERMPRHLEVALIDYAIGGGLEPEIDLDTIKKLYEFGLVGGPGYDEGTTAKGNLYLNRILPGGLPEGDYPPSYDLVGHLHSQILPPGKEWGKEEYINYLRGLEYNDDEIGKELREMGWESDEDGQGEDKQD
jgi:hypothetical protein